MEYTENNTMMKSIVYKIITQDNHTTSIFMEYIYMYTYTHTHTHMYIYTHTHIVTFMKIKY